MVSDIQVPTSKGQPTREPETHTAIWHPHDEVDPEWREIPERVANELDLEPGDKLTVKQRPVMHYEDGRIARGALDEEGYVQEMHLLQRVIDATVESSNFGIPDLPVVPRGDDEFMNAPELCWFLYDWLGAKRIAQRISNAGAEIDEFKKKHGSR